MITVLVDHDIEGHAELLWSAMASEGWLELQLFRLATFRDMRLPTNSTDRNVWRFAQAHGMVLLTGNRNMDGADSLELTLREENTFSSLPVVTIARVDRIVERLYRESCATHLAEIVLYLDNYLGTGRQFIP